MINIILFGHSGMLGTYIKNYLSNKINLICLGREQYDITSYDIIKLELLIRNNCRGKNNFIINCCAALPQKYSEDKIETYIYVNILFNFHLDIICRLNNIRLVNISTNSVFGQNYGNRREDDEVLPRDLYSITKFYGELASPNSIIIRTSIIGENNYLLKWVLNSKEDIHGFDNHLWNGVTCLELSKIIYCLIQKNKKDGIIHVICDRIVSKYYLLQIIKEVYGLTINIKKTDGKYTDYTLDTKHKENMDYELKSIRTQLEDTRNLNG